MGEVAVLAISCCELDSSHQRYILVATTITTTRGLCNLHQWCYIATMSY